MSKKVKVKGFNAAIIGTARRACSHESPFCYRQVVAYSYEKCIEILMDRGMSYNDAVEYFEYEALGEYAGESTPVFISTED